MLDNRIKKSYAEEIEGFVAAGGVIAAAENTNQVKFNYHDADAAERSKSKLDSVVNQEAREKAANAKLVSYKTYAPCKLCLTSERSVKTNVCLECDRRRARVKFGVNSRSLDQIGDYLVKQGKSHTFISGGKEYKLKVEEA